MRCEMKPPLDGIRVIDWTVMQQGPVASVMLGDLGAEVIKIEQRGTGDLGRGVRRIHGVTPPLLPGGRSYYFETMNRNKKGIAIDLKKEKGREVVYRLVKNADVFVQNFRQGVASRLGMDYETLSRYNSRLIYATATGYGPLGPDSAKPSFDYAGQARAGVMSNVGELGMPPLGGPLGLADHSGATLLAYGILAALFARERTGEGQAVDGSLLGSMIWLQGLVVSYRLMLGQDIPRTSRAKAGNALWNHYRCSDDRWLCFAMTQSEKYWHDFCRALSIEELEHDPKFKDVESRRENGGELVSILDRIFATKTRAEWVKTLDETADFAYASVNTTADLMADPQVIANRYIVDFDHPALGTIKVVGSPVSFSKAEVGPRLPAPELGEHTEEVLLELGGYDWDELAELKELEVI